MNRTRFSLVAAALLALGLAACSNDSSPTGGGTPDTTPPGVTSVTPVDAYHIDITFSEQVTKSSAEDDGHYSIIEATLALAVAPRAQKGAPGDPVSIAAASLGSNKKTVTLTTETSMAGLNFDVSVQGVSDTHGNDITDPISKPFTGSDNPDVTAPTIVSRSPAPGATNVALGATVIIQFSEAVTTTSFNSGATWSSGGGPVLFDVTHDGATFTLTSGAPLEKNTIYTVALTGVQDASGNIVTTTEWSFTTTNVTDITPPTLVSTSPANLATNVDVNANLSLTFSEPINQTESTVQLTPDPGEGVPTWSDGGKTVTFDPIAPLLADQQYTLTIYPNGVFDLSGNGIAGLHTVVFTTGSSLAAGSIAGTITGDPGSEAADPTGATVIAADGKPFGGAFNILGSTKVAGNNTYTISHLPDGNYWLLSILDTSGDGNLDPSSGDAIGAYGVNFTIADLNPDSVAVAGGAHVTGINWTMIDPSAITGTVSYSGTAQGDFPVFVGLFDTSNFSPTDSPVAGTEAFGAEHAWGFNTLDQPLADDTYYVGAYMDVNINGNYDPATDPAGFYGGLPAPTALNISNGHDISGIVIPIADPVTAANSSVHLAWPAAKHNAQFQRLSDAVRQAQLQASK
jgi:methionine-rich copper-binding protein CopC